MLTAARGCQLDWLHALLGIAAGSLDSAAQLALDVVADAGSGGEALCQRPPRADAPRLVLRNIEG